MALVWKLSKQDYAAHIPEYPGASKGYRYEVYSASDGQYQKFADRWNGEQQRITKLQERLFSDHRWDLIVGEHEGMKSIPDLAEGRGGIQIDGIIYPYRRDLRGLCISKLNITQEEFIHALHYTWFDYCRFEQCKFVFIPRPGYSGTGLFFDNSIKHARFDSCEFASVSFWSGEYKNIVFSNCEFHDVIFNRNTDGKYENIMFHNCVFKSVDFTRINIEQFCFSGKCEFLNIKIDSEALSQTSKPIGTVVIDALTNWDRHAYHDRLQSKEQISPSLKALKYQTASECYLGLSKFYRTISLQEETDGFYKNVILWQYLSSWTLGEHRLLRYGWRSNLRELFSRHLIGYGAKPERPMFAWISMNVLFSFVYLLTGIWYRESIIQRKFGFAPDQLWNTFRDFGICFYYSVITSTTVGYGDISPKSGLSMLLCSLHAVLGLLLMTMFTVVFARRFFK